MKSLPPVSILPLGAGSLQYWPAQPAEQEHRKWRPSLRLIQVAPFSQMPGFSHSSLSMHWVAPSRRFPKGQLENKQG